ncbi:MAG: cyclic nucleotide-binding domain-containing protein [Desulfobulbaceae bacterium]|nr:cyclic nucleotide-binding domain-containing protein [Desulfobulbaceae bacterium]
MLELINNPENKKYLVEFCSGDVIFLEGDETTDLYILISGKVILVKGTMKISEISEPGSIFGEMAYLLNERRSATSKALLDVKAIRVPGDEIQQFVDRFPTIAPEITRRLAMRLRDTTRVMYGFKEFCDQMPDAVIMTDKERRILAWNRAAEKLYGRTWSQMRHKSLDQIYEDQASYKQFITELQAARTVREKPLKIHHPDDSWRFVSTSTTMLYDDSHNVQGYLFLGRDATNAHKLEQRHRRVWKWMVPGVILLCVSLGIMLWGYPKFSKGLRILDYKECSFQKRIIRDYNILKTSLAAPGKTRDLNALTRVMDGYFVEMDPIFKGVVGLVLLDWNKKVVNACSVKPIKKRSSIVGSSYSGISFSRDEKAVYSILTLFRSSPNHPLGAEGVEIAFKMDPVGNNQWWLIFQLDMNWLGNEYGIDTGTLKNMRFDLLPGTE